MVERDYDLRMEAIDLKNELNEARFPILTFFLSDEVRTKQAKKIDAIVKKMDALKQRVAKRDAQVTEFCHRIHT